MHRLFAIIGLLVTPLMMGCVTCDSPFDQDYTASGGSIQRTDAAGGRVNSAFVPGPAAGSVPPAAEENQATYLPLPVDAAAYPAQQ